MITELSLTLRHIADELDGLDYNPVEEAILVTRDLATGIITFHCWGDKTRLLEDAYELKVSANMRRKN